jgi:AraC-like DNA-binding protein
MFLAHATPIKSEGHPFKVAKTHLYLPSLALGGCVRAYVSRNTTGASLSAHELLNHYPASPLCTLMWVIEGDGQLRSKGGVLLNKKLASRMLLSGPHTVPSVTENFGNVHGFMAFLMPDALHALTGLDISTFVNESYAVSDVLDASWQGMAQAVLSAPDDAARIDCIELFLRPRWQACRERGENSTARYHDWMLGLATRVALSGAGKSARYFERRIKRWSGLSLQRLRGLARAETSFFEARDAGEQAMLSWAEVAFNTGYSDQAHLCREVRRVTGFSPEEVKRNIETEESFWIYRLWT